MKYFLTITFCSLLDNSCVTPYTFNEAFDDLYTCQIVGYKKSIEKIEELGIDRINDYKIYTKFACNPIKTI
tara:strand:- start:381 stop:593 length:213 start_codon:yes stop_codon:yes gene_type:complete